MTPCGRDTSLQQHLENLETSLKTVVLTNSDLDVVSGGGVLQVVDGAQHVQGHVADVVRVEGGLVGNPRHHHVGVANRLHLSRVQSGG